MTDPAVSENSPRGLGGWLIFVGVGLVLGLVLRSFHVFRIVRALTAPSLHLITNPHSAGYIPGYVGILKFELTAQLLLLAANILAAILFMKESRAFPGFWVIYLGLQIVFAATDHALMSHAIAGSPPQLQQDLRATLQFALPQIALTAAAATIWTAYIFQSRRVKATFVH